MLRSWSHSLETLEDRTAPAVLTPLPPAAPPGAPTSSDPATAYVQALYLDVLGRNAAAPEIHYWAYVVGTYGPAQAASGILNSPESQAHIVDNLYVELLGRHADPGGLLYWKGVLVGDGLEAVTAGLMASNEFQSEHPGNAVAAAYQEMLGRAPGTSDLAYWTALFSVHGSGAVVRGIEASAEFRTDVTQFLFGQELHRSASATEADFFAQNSALGLLQIEATILASPEFQHDAGF